MGTIKENSNLLSAPYHFACCFNAQCTKAEKCLRQLAAANDANCSLYITIVNPSFLPVDTSNCQYFHAFQKDSHTIWGIKRFFDKMPCKEAVSIRKLLINHFGKSNYYRIYNEECPLVPNDQTYYSNKKK